MSDFPLDNTYRFWYNSRYSRGGTRKREYEKTRIGSKEKNALQGQLVFARFSAFTR